MVGATTGDKEDAKWPVPPHVPGHLIKQYPFSFGATTDQNPYDDVIPEWHKGPPISYSPSYYANGQGAWIVRRGDDLRKIFFDSQNFSNRDMVPIAEIAGEGWKLIPLEIDPPMHGLYRAFVAPLLSPKAVSALDGRIRDYARACVERIRPAGSCEFMSDIAFEFPITIFLELMGLPTEMAPQFREWEADLNHADSYEAIEKAVKKISAYLRTVIEDRKQHPKDDLISHAIRAEIDGRKLTDKELMGFSFTLFLGGLDTISSTMGIQMWHLARHPAHQAALRDNPALIPDALDEFMRAYGISDNRRRCTVETVVNGVTIMPGDLVVLSTPLGGRDPESFERPNEIILDRKPKMLSFGYGAHLCVGMHVARRILRIALEEILPGLPEFRLQDKQMSFYAHGVIQPKSVHLCW